MLRMMAALNSMKELSTIPRVRPPTAPTHPRSPKRVLSSSTPNSRLLHALDMGNTVQPTISNEPSDYLEASSQAQPTLEVPFGATWPPKSPRRLVKLNATGGVILNPKPSTPKSDKSLITDFQSQKRAAVSGQIEHRLSNDEKVEISAGPSSKASKENIPADQSPLTVVRSPPKALPRYSYKNYNPSPTRVYVRNSQEAEDLVMALSGPLGFDLEWRAVFRRGVPERPVATVQICDHRMILVIQVTAMKSFPKKLKEVLEDPKIPKIGVNILNDGVKLSRDYGVRAQGLVELGGLARQADADYVERYFRFAPAPKQSTSPASVASASSSKEKEKEKDGSNATGEPPAPKMRKPGFMISLATITAMYTEHALAKGSVRTSNWEVQPLRENQLEYAANDAHCALMVYDTLMEMAQKASVQLDASRFTQHVKFVYGSKPNNVPKSSSSGVGAASRSGSTSAQRPPAEKEQVASGGTSTNAAPMSKSKNAKQKFPAGTVHQRPQHIRAYNLWQHNQAPIPEMCATLRSADNPLKVGTVIYVVGAIQADPTLNFCHERLTELLKAEDASWNRHKQWYDGLDAILYTNMINYRT